MAAVAAITFLVAVVAIPARATYGAQVTSDEPQYLLTALSLAEDADLDIADELADRRYTPFHRPALDPQTFPLDDTGRQLSPHDPLLPVLLAPAMAVGGWVAAKVLLALLAALTAVAAVWLAVHRFGVSPGTAGLVTGAMFAAPPLTSYATQVYPEMPAALLTVIGVAAVTAVPVGSAARRNPARALVAAVAIVALPWLSIKYVPVAAVLAVALLVPMVRRDRLAAAAWAATLAGAGVLYLVFHRQVYGGWTVYAAGDHFVDGEFGVIGTDPDYSGRSRRLIGLLIDRGFGLIAWTPAYLLLVPAVIGLARRRPPGWGVSTAALAATWAVATWVALTMHGWWWPGRQVVAALPLGVAAIAGLVDQYRWLRIPTVGAALMGTFTWLWLAVEASTGRRALIVDFAQTAEPRYRLWSTFLPDHTTFGGVDVVATLVWSAFLLTLGVAAWRSSPSDGSVTADGSP